MRSNLAWLIAIVVIAAMGAWVSRERAPHGGRTATGVGAPSTRPSTYVPTDADVAEARKILGRTGLPQAESERRLVFYNDLRDHMDQRAYGVLEAVAQTLRAAPGSRVSLGYDLRTFYAATGGDDDIKGTGEEDWERLMAFSAGWLTAIPRSVTARISHAQASCGMIGILGASQDRPSHSDSDEGLPQAVAELPDSTELVPMDAHEVEMLNALSYSLCIAGYPPSLPREAFRKLGSYVDWRGFPQAEKLEAYRAWAEGRGPRP